MEITNKQIREECGHNGVTCRVVIKRNGEVMRYGSPMNWGLDMNRWHGLGTRESIVLKMKAEQQHLSTLFKVFSLLFY